MLDVNGIKCCGYSISGEWNGQKYTDADKGFSVCGLIEISGFSYNQISTEQKAKETLNKIYDNTYTRDKEKFEKTGNIFFAVTQLQVENKQAFFLQWLLKDPKTKLVYKYKNNAHHPYNIIHIYMHHRFPEEVNV